MARQRQIRRTASGGSGGPAVDRVGAPVIDPTENVLALVDVQKEHAEQLRIADQKYSDDMRRADARFDTEMRRADNQRLSELAALKQNYDKQISDILTVQVKTTSELISTQLEKVTTSLSNQINAQGSQQTSLMTTLSERIGRLEQSQWQSVGRTSVSDPATADAISRMEVALRSLGSSRDTGAGKSAGGTALWGLIAGGIGILIAFGTFVTVILRFAR